MLQVTPRSCGALQLLGPDRADVLEPQPVVVARVLAQRLFIHVEDGVDAGVALHVAGHRPAQREVGADDLGAAARGCSWRARTNPVSRRWCGWPSVSRYGKRQVDVADPRRAVDPDLDADLAHHVVAVAGRRVGGHLRGRTSRRCAAARVSWSRSWSSTGRNIGSNAISEQVVSPAPVEPRALGEQHRRVVGGVDRAAEQREHRAGLLGGAVELAVGVAAVTGRPSGRGCRGSARAARRRAS